MNWRSRPLTDSRTIVELIAATPTTSGPTVQAAYDTEWHATGVKVSAEDFANIPLTPHTGRAKWNYTIAQSIPR